MSDASSRSIGARRQRTLQRMFRVFLRIPVSSRFYWFQLLVDNGLTLASMIFLVALWALALSAPALGFSNPRAVDPLNRPAAPSSDAWLGTDHIGRYTFTRTVYRTSVSLLIGLTVTALAAIIGMFIGMMDAFSIRLENVAMRVMDGLMAFPGILWALRIMASLGPRAINVVIALVVVNTLLVAHLARGTALVTKEELYIEAAIQSD